MSLFGAINISGTGVSAMQTWIDTSAGNIANADDEVAPSAKTYAPQTAVFSPAAADDEGIGQGVKTDVLASSTEGILAPDPTSPLADGQGEVREPNISLDDQLVGLMQAQEGYQANTSAISRAISAYQSGLTIGT